MHGCMDGKVSLGTPAEKSAAQVLAEKIRAARVEILKLSQAQFSTRMGVSQSNVSRWEAATLKPEPEYLIKLSALLSGHHESFYFLEEAGVPAGFLEGDAPYGPGVMPSELWAAQAEEARKNFLYVPLLRDAAAAGTPRVIDPKEVETVLAVHRSFAAPGAALVALRVKGQSMSPVLEDGYVVVVDTAQTEARRLRGHMVVARYGEEVTIKWLRELKGRYILVPQRTSPRFDIQEIDEADGWGLVGAVVHWIGFPPPTRR